MIDSDDHFSACGRSNISKVGAAAAIEADGRMSHGLMTGNAADWLLGMDAREFATLA